jgi:hypothetical protein
MKPIEFLGQNTVYAKDQSEYLPLPVHRTPDGTVISCWQMTWRERVKALLTGRVWLTMLTFNQPLQPQRVDIDCPFTLEKN